MPGTSRPTRRHVVGRAVAMLLTPRGWRVVCASAAVAAITCGMIGLRLMFHAGAQTISFFDELYGALSLFVLQPPDTPDGIAMSPWLQVARFLAPAATFYAVADALVLPVTRLQARFSRGHAVVCGSGPTAVALAERLHAAGRDVVLVTERDPGPLDAHARDRGITLLVGDPTRRAVLRGSGLARAGVLYVVGPETVANASVVFAAAELVADRRTLLPCYVEESDPDVYDALWVLTLRRAPDDRLRVEFFNTGRLGVRQLLGDLESNWTPARDVPVAIAGFGAFGQELLVEIARRRAPSGGGRLPVVVADTAAGAAAEKLRARYGVIDDALDVHVVDRPADQADLNTLSHPSRPGALLGQVFVCHDDEELALRRALATARPPSRHSVVVRVHRDNPLARALRPDRPRGDGPLESLYGKLVVFSELDRLVDPALVVDDRLERLAAGVHAHYVRNRLAQGEDPAGNEALVAWEALPERYRSANYDQARDIEVKLRAAGLASAPMTTGTEAFTFTPDEVERLAELEHERWMAERRAAGWTYGPVRDNDDRTHPDLRPYAGLSVEAKDKDRQAVRLIPDLLAAAGYRVVRPGGR